MYRIKFNITFVFEYFRWGHIGGDITKFVHTRAEEFGYLMYDKYKCIVLN